MCDRSGPGLQNSKHWLVSTNHTREREKQLFMIKLRLEFSDYAWVTAEPTSSKRFTSRNSRNIDLQSTLYPWTVGSLYIAQHSNKQTSIARTMDLVSCKSYAESNRPV